MIPTRTGFSVGEWLLGAVTVMNTPTSPQRPHVFVEGNDYNLWCRWSDGAAWQWLNMGKPQGVNIVGSVAAVSVMDTPTSPPTPTTRYA
jgi:hypothetical protein